MWMAPAGGSVAALVPSPGEFVAFDTKLSVEDAKKVPQNTKGELLVPIVRYDPEEDGQVPFGVCLGVDVGYGRSGASSERRRRAHASCGSSTSYTISSFGEIGPG